MDVKVKETFAETIISYERNTIIIYVNVDLSHLQLQSSDLSSNKHADPFLLELLKVSELHHIVC